MNDMKNYNRAMDKLRVSDRVKEDLFRELDTKQETRRIVQHSAWQKPAAAAAVAAVVGLNVFAVMQLRGGAPVTPGTSEGTESSAVSDGTFVPVDVELPDLSEFGIDTSTFVQLQEPYTDSEQLDLTYRWEYTEEKPRENWTQYKNEAGALLVYDAQGRFRRFVNVPEIAEQLDSEPAEDAQQIDETILRFLQKTMPEQAFDPEEVYTIRTGSETGYENLGITQLSNGGWAKYTLNNDAEVCSVKIELHDTPANSDFSIEEYNAAAEKLIGVIADDGTGEITDRRFVIFDGKILGMYQILLGERSNEGTEDEEVSYGNFGFLISPEYTLPEKPEQTEPEQTEPTEPNDIGLPDLSAYGIDTSEFTLLNESQNPLNGDWFYDSDPQPQVKMTVFQNPAGDTITLDIYDRLIDYTRKASQSIPNSETEARTALKKEIIQTLTSPSAVIWSDESTGGSYFNASYSWVYTDGGNEIARQIKALAFVSLAEDNSVQNIGIDYRIEPEQYAPFTDEAKRLAETYYGVTDPHYTAQTYTDIDGIIYGIFSFETAEGTRELIARAPQVYSFEQYGIGGTYTKEKQELFTLPGIWPYDDEPAPAIPCDVYVSDAGEKVWLDPQGRVIRYQAPDNLAQSGPSYGLGQADRKSQPLVKGLTGAAEANFADWYEENNRFYHVLMASDSSMTTTAEAHVTMLKDLTLEYFSIDYLDWEQDFNIDEEALKDYAVEAKRLGYIANLQNGWRIALNGQTYGVFKQKGLNDWTGIRDTEDRVIVRLDNTVQDFAESLKSAGIGNIGSTDFKATNLYYTGGERGFLADRQLSGYWLSDSPLPTEYWTEYTNGEGVSIVRDAQGNIRRFFSAELDADFSGMEYIKNEEKLTATANRFFAAANPALNWLAEHESRAWDQAAGIRVYEWVSRNFSSEHGAAEYHADFYFNNAGELIAYTSDLMGSGAAVPAEAQAALADEAARLLAERFSLPETSITSACYDQFGGKSLGFFRFTDAAGTEGTLIVE